MNSEFSTERWDGQGRPQDHTPDQEQTAPVRIIADRYRVEGRLGRGGFGEVFLAYDERLGRRVALKLLRFAEADEKKAADRTQRFLGEARTLARLDHPNIVPVWDAGIEEDRPWIAMRIVEGESVRSALETRGPFSGEAALHLFSQIAGALGHAHRLGIVHRDVKPENILLEIREGSEHAWLSDFGIAKLLGGQPLTSDRAAVGTPGYMAPEQVAGKKIDARADIFALGCVAGELLTGRRTFSGESVGEVLNAIIHLSPDLDDLSTRAVRGFEAVVRRCLAKSPDDRWQTIDELTAELRALSTGATRRVPKTAFSWLRRRRSPPWDGAYPLVIEGLRKGYGFRRPILSDLNLHIPRGSVYALLGRNGCGKSTLLRTCLGIYRRDKGRVELFGRDPEREGPAVLGRVGLALDAPAVDERMKVRELLTFTSHFYPQWDQAYCYRLLARYELPLEAKIRNMSRGMKTKVSLILALAHRPELLILDDPALGLDAVVLDELMETLEEVSRTEGATILIASHNYEEVERIATHVGLLRDGKIVLTDRLDRLKQHACEVRVTFPHAVPDLTTLRDLRILRTEGTQITGVVLDTRAGTLEELKAMTPDEMTVRELSLRELFVGFLR